jgi:hypothetical protein
MGFLPSLAVLSFLSTAVIIFQMYLLSVIINDVFMLNKSPGKSSALPDGSSNFCQGLAHLAQGKVRTTKGREN